jgi:hypothetical protein
MARGIIDGDKISTTVEAIMVIQTGTEDTLVHTLMDLVMDTGICQATIGEPMLNLQMMPTRTVREILMALVNLKREKLRMLLPMKELLSK